MKTILLFIFMTVSSFVLFGQTETSRVLDKTDSLISHKKYATAFKFLQETDPANSDPDIFLKKEDIALNYFVTSIMHQMFAFRDIGENEDIMDYRGKEGNYDMFTFPVDSILLRLIKEYPDNCKLYKGLGDYYYEVHLKYGDQWLIPTEQLLRLIEKNDLKVHEGGCADDMTYYVLGYIYVSSQKYDNAVSWFKRSLELSEKNPDAFYNLAYAYMGNGDMDNALKNAGIAMELYHDSVYKADAVRMMAQLYLEKGDEENAARSFETSLKIDPGSYYSLHPLLELYVKTNRPEADDIRRDFFALDPGNPTIYNDLAKIYFKYDKAEELTGFFEDELKNYRDNDSITGNLNFFLGRIYLGIDKSEAKNYLLQAREHFSKVYDKDHQVFRAIEQGLEQLEK